MEMTINSPPSSDASPGHSALVERREALRRNGFTPETGCWRRGELVYRHDDNWITLDAAWPDNADPLTDHLGAPGLWKPLRIGRSLRRVFAVQDALLRANEALSGEDRSTFESVLEWALATADGAAPSSNPDPDCSSLDSYLPKDRLTLVHGSFTRQVQVIHARGRLALRLPIVTVVPPDLPEARWRWLRALLFDAQNDHHLFRLGFTSGSGPVSAVAEADLSGIPAVLLEPMLSRSLDALRWVAVRLVESANFLAQADAAARALEICAVPETNP